MAKAICILTCNRGEVMDRDAWETISTRAFDCDEMAHDAMAEDLHSRGQETTPQFESGLECTRETPLRWVHEFNDGGIPKWEEWTMICVPLQEHRCGR